LILKVHLPPCFLQLDETKQYWKEVPEKGIPTPQKQLKPRVCIMSQLTTHEAGFQPDEKPIRIDKSSHAPLQLLSTPIAQLNNYDLSRPKDGQRIQGKSFRF